MECLSHALVKIPQVSINLSNNLAKQNLPFNTLIGPNLLFVKAMQTRN